jgi:hypothetical protein
MSLGEIQREPFVRDQHLCGFPALLPPPLVALGQPHLFVADSPVKENDTTLTDSIATPANQILSEIRK